MSLSNRGYLYVGGVSYAMTAIFLALSWAGICELFPVAFRYPHYILGATIVPSWLLLRLMIKRSEWTWKIIGYCAPLLVLHFVAFDIRVIAVHTLSWFLAFYGFRKFQKNYKPSSYAISPLQSLSEDWHREQNLKKEVEESIRKYYESTGETPPGDEAKRPKKPNQPYKQPKRWRRA